MEKILNARNTLVKICLDQSIGAVVNVAAYIGGTRALRGVPLDVCKDVVIEVRTSSSNIQVMTIANLAVPANVAYNESRLQAVARSQSDTACFHTGGKENGCG